MGIAKQGYFKTVHFPGGECLRRLQYMGWEIAGLRGLNLQTFYSPKQTKRNDEESCAILSPVAVHYAHEQCSLASRLTRRSKSCRT
jgi:hypothetical protein